MSICNMQGFLGRTKGFAMRIMYSSQTQPFSRQCCRLATSRHNNPIARPYFPSSSFSSLCKDNATSGLLGNAEASVLPSRGYAKGKAKGKDKGGRSKKEKSGAIYLSNEELNSVINFTQLTEHMDQALAHLKQDYIQQLSLRTSVGLFDNLVIDTPEGQFPLIQLGQIAQKNPQLIVVNMGTMPQYTANVKQAILDSGMNLNPQQDGTSLFIPIPKVTKEHREHLAKNAKTLCDKTKNKVKDIQNKYIRELKKAEKLHSEDLLHNLQTAIHDQAHKFTAIAEEIMVAKQKELLGGK